MAEPVRDFGQEAQKAGEAHLAACMEAFYDEQENDGEGAVDSPASAPFDGCDTCIVREVLFAAWPTIDAYADDAVAGLIAAVTEWDLSLSDACDGPERDKVRETIATLTGGKDEPS